MQLDIIRETEVNITSAMADQSDSLAAEKKNHKRSSDLLTKVQKKLAAQPGTLFWSPTTAHMCLQHGIRVHSALSLCQPGVPHRIQKAHT